MKLLPQKTQMQQKQKQKEGINKGILKMNIEEDVGINIISLDIDGKLEDGRTVHSSVVVFTRGW